MNDGVARPVGAGRLGRPRVLGHVDADDTDAARASLRHSAGCRASAQGARRRGRRAPGSRPPPHPGRRRARLSRPGCAPPGRRRRRRCRSLRGTRPARAGRSACRRRTPGTHPATRLHSRQHDAVPARREMSESIVQLRPAPQATSNGTDTRSPTLTNRTPGPTSSTTPMFSWPRTLPTSTDVRPSYMCRSESQMLLVVSRITASVPDAFAADAYRNMLEPCPGRGFGTGLETCGGC